MIYQHPVWHLAGFGLFLLLFVIHFRVKKSGIFVVALWSITGVVLHELAHLLAGILFGARPVNISLLPRFDGRKWRLGSVSFTRITAWNAVPVALAPIALIGVAYMVASYWFSLFKPSLAATLCLYATIFFLSYNALPSTHDLRIAGNWRSILLYGSLAIFITACSAWSLLIRHWL